MRFWNRPPGKRRRQTECAVRRHFAANPAKSRVWAVADAATDRCLGMVNYLNASPQLRSADIGYLIHPSYHRQGIVNEAVTALIECCFGTLAMHRLTAFIDRDNNASCRLAKNLGFRREGLLRKSVYLNGA